MTTATVLVPRHRLPRWLDNFARHHGEPESGLRRPAADGDDDRDVLELRSPDGAVARVLVPYGPVAAADDPRAAVLAHLAVDRTVGVLLVRRGGHAAGVFVGDRLAVSKVGSSYVQGRTKAGGWSQQRYARRRANQTDKAAGRAADDAVRVLVDEAPGSLVALQCGGDRSMCEQVLTDPRLAGVAPLWRPRRAHPVPDPRLATLRAFVDRVCGVEVELNEQARPPQGASRSRAHRSASRRR